MDDTLAAKRAIQEVVNDWVVFSDSGNWEGFASVWHDDAWMTSTWFQGPASEFQKARRAGFERGVSIIHFLGGTSIDVSGRRAIAQTKMTISQRAAVDDVIVDAVCTGRFYDFFEQRAGRWAIVRRQPIYEKDRLDPVEPGAKLALDPALLASFPDGYRHLGYLQTKAGFKVRLGLPQLRGPEVAKLYAEGAAWLEGSATPGTPL
jgi:SnoaL-like domain